MSLFRDKDAKTDIWIKYEKGKEHHQQKNIFKKTERNYNFFNGNQWAGLESGGEEMPALNIIKGIGKYKISMIAQNLMNITYTSLSGNPQEIELCEQLNYLAAKQWEKTKMDSLSWAVIKNAFISGDDYVYFCDKRAFFMESKTSMTAKRIGKTSIYFGDEQNSDINKQPYIIVVERMSVEDIKTIARQNKIDEKDVELITSDEETEEQVNYTSSDEVKSESGKATTVLYFEMTNEGVKYCRSSKNVIFEPFKLMKGLMLYPICGFRWDEKINDARGYSGVETIIPNQIEINKTLARRSVAVKRFSFPTLVYDKDKISNVADLEKTGANIEVDNLNETPVSSVIQYLNPAPISSDAEQLQAELINMTKELEGAGDAATGQIDPTKASGEAIKAARDQAAIPLNEQIATYRQFIEDIALLWLKMWAVFSTDEAGLEIQVETESGEAQTAVISKEALISLDVAIKIDVSPVDPFSKLSQGRTLENLLLQKHITFEEYVDMLDDSSTVPKAKLKQILEERNKNIPSELLELLRNNPQAVNAVMSMLSQSAPIGGDQNAMSGMQ